jgi:hypothetical protein
MIDKMRVYKITEFDSPNNPLYTTSITDFSSLEFDELGSKYIVEVIEMDTEEFYHLPEWDGF